MNSFSSRGTFVPLLSIVECPDGSRGLTKSLGCRLSPQRVDSWGSLSCSSELKRTHGIVSCVGDTPSPLVVGVFAVEYEDSGDISPPFALLLGDRNVVEREVAEVVVLVS